MDFFPDKFIVPCYSVFLMYSSWSISRRREKREAKEVITYQNFLWISWATTDSQNTHPPFLFLGDVSSQRRSRFKRVTRSLAMFVRSHHSLRSLTPQRSALPRSLAPFTGSLRSQARSLTSLTPSWDSWNSWICVHTFIALHGNKAFFICTRNTPQVSDLGTWTEAFSDCWFVRWSVGQVWIGRYGTCVFF